ncbi:cytochrome P450 [Alicyclobacillus dauci]|uniref:Cytochrome P450 n=1 Tax=Alicyclobacillus dauci TaxID=1475485 RepID=A0ABY6Z5J4_9BACL|nr:cytochrome P450 [Alicyclobacillus dauci]
MLQHILSLTDEFGNPVAHKEIRDNIVTVGHETIC